MKPLEELMRDWPGDAVVWRHDPQTDTSIFVALHDTHTGPATGGTRIKTYETTSQALLDAQRLAEGMSHKWRGIGLAKGGGKAVLAVPEGLSNDERNGLLLRYAELIESLGGAFQTGPDMGTTARDMLHMSARTKFIHGLYGKGEALDPGPYTARGVLRGIQASLKAVFGSSDLVGRSVLVEGVGSVGLPLAKELAALGATLLVSDLNQEVAQAVASQLGGTSIQAAHALQTECDVYAPCAVGARVNQQSLPGLRCKIVAGSANNQLERPEDAEALHAKGILYAPDYIINGGGALVFATMDSAAAEPPSMSSLERIGARLGEIFAESAARDESPATVAQRWVEAG